MNLQLTYDPSVANAPAGFVSALNYVVSFLDSVFTNPVTVNIAVGWGEIYGQSLGSNTLGESIESVASAFTYSQVRNALVAGANSVTAEAAAASLPAGDPTGGGSIDTGTAEAKALGLMPANAAATDGWIGFSSTPNTFTFDPSNRAVSGEYDFVGVALHEITEVMGRDADLGSGPFSGASYTVLDLFRFSGPGVHDLTNGGRFSSAYFSVDGGNVDLANFNTDPSGDYGDWANSAGNDSLAASSPPSVVNAFTASDLAATEALGWNISAAATSLDAPNVTNFVEQLYQMALLRAGSASDAAAWTNYVGQTTVTAGQLANDFAASPEAQNLVFPIVRLYQTVFDRAPDPAGLGDWVNALRNGESLNAIAQSFIQAPEFQLHYGGNPTPTAYVTALYESALGRSPDVAGEQGWLAVLGPTPTVAAEATVALGFSQSAEFLADSTGAIASWLSAAALSDSYGSSIAYHAIISAAKAASSDVSAAVHVVGIADSAHAHAPFA